jgi:hypothetical protein
MVSHRALSQRLIGYTLGGGTCLFIVSLIGSVALTGQWITDNKWVNRQYGLQFLLYQLALVIVILSVVSLLCILIAFALRFRFPDSVGCGLLYWVLGYILFFVPAMCSVAIIHYTRFGDTPIPTFYNYYDMNTDFKDYVDKFTKDPWPANGGTTSQTGFPPNWAGMLTDAKITLDTAAATSLPALVQPYFRKEDGEFAPHNVTLCAIDWQQILDAGQFDGSPCSLVLTDSDWECIGQWTPTAVAEYWCALTNDNLEIREERRLEQEFREKEQGTRTRQFESTDRLDIFGEINVIVLSIELAAFAVSAIGLFMDLNCGKKARHGGRHAAPSGEPGPKPKPKGRTGPQAVEDAQAEPDGTGAGGQPKAAPPPRAQGESSSYEYEEDAAEPAPPKKPGPAPAAPSRGKPDTVSESEYEYETSGTGTTAGTTTTTSTATTGTTEESYEYEYQYSDRESRPASPAASKQAKPAAAKDESSGSYEYVSEDETQPGQPARPAQPQAARPAQPQAGRPAQPAQQEESGSEYTYEEQTE